MKLLPMPQLDKENSKLLRKFVFKHWFGIIIALLLFWFIFFEKYKLISGGIILLLIGFKNYYLEGIQEKKPLHLLFGVPVIYMGLVSLITNFLLPKQVDLFILLVTFVFICIFILYNILINYISKWINIITFIILIYFLIIVTISINSSLVYINSNGFSNLYFYFGFIGFLILSTFAYFTLFRILFGFIKKYYNCSLFNNYFYLSLATMSIILFGGYYYLQNLSQNKLRDFLLIISLAFVTSFVGSSAVKKLESKNN